MSDIRFEQIKVLTVRLRNKLILQDQRPTPTHNEEGQTYGEDRTMLFPSIVLMSDHFNSSDPHNWGAGGQCSRVG